MQRRTFLQCGLAATMGSAIYADPSPSRFNPAIDSLFEACANKQVASATIHVRQGGTKVSSACGKARNIDEMFLLGSISKPICIAAVMSLFDRGEFKLDDPVQKFLPQFTGDRRDEVTMRHLMTHVSGLPDQLPENNQLRKQHAGLEEFVDLAIRTPLSFQPATRYQYSSMAILLASHVAELISGVSILKLVERAVFRPLGMNRSAIGLGAFKLGDFQPVQTEHAAPESGGGDPGAKEWDWNSAYWRQLGAPWGGVHCSAPDVATFLAEFLFAHGKVVKPETAKLMLSNHNAQGLTPRGLGFNIGAAAGSPGCSERTFGHTGSTGTIAWADPTTQTVCVILTTLPGGAVKPHPRDIAAAHVAEAAK